MYKHQKIYNRKEVKHILEKYSIALKKRWGQNFLTNLFFADKIVSLVFDLITKNRESETRRQRIKIWEIGGGLGSLSALFLSQDVVLTLFELDHGIIRFLQEEFFYEIENGTLHIVAGDAEKSIAKHVENGVSLPHVLCGNLPYSSAVRILISICSIEQLQIPAVYMIQKEAVDRLVSKEGVHQYGISSVLMQSVFALSRLCSVSADSFYPVPKVASTVFSCTPHSKMQHTIFTILSAILHTAFNQRRKKVHNILVSWLNSMPHMFSTDTTQEEAKTLLEHCGIGTHMRAENITVQSYVKLAERIAGKKIDEM